MRRGLVLARSAGLFAGLAVGGFALAAALSARGADVKPPDAGTFTGGYPDVDTVPRTVVESADALAQVWRDSEGNICASVQWSAAAGSTDQMCSDTTTLATGIVYAQSTPRLGGPSLIFGLVPDDAGSVVIDGQEVLASSNLWLTITDKAPTEFIVMSEDESVKVVGPIASPNPPSEPQFESP